jgi:hypothetical protein
MANDTTQLARNLDNGKLRYRCRFSHGRVAVADLLDRDADLLADGGSAAALLGEALKNSGENLACANLVNWFAVLLGIHASGH